MARILVVEDDPNVAVVVEAALTAQNHIVEAVVTGQEGLERLLYYHYDLAIIDWGLPIMTGIEVCQHYRQKGGRAPILFLTGQSDVPSKVRAFDTGADDYLCKPFSFDELMARVAVLLRRPPSEQSPQLQSGSLLVDQDKCQVTISGETVDLAPSEFALLQLLMTNPGQVFTAEAIVDRVYRTEAIAADKAVRQRVMMLRKKLSKDDHSASIVTVKGQGYKFEDDASRR